MEDGTERNALGININQEEIFGIWNKIKFAFQKFIFIVSSMLLTLGGLIIAKISVNSMPSPVGIYNVVGESVSYGIQNGIYLLAYLSINAGLINILSFPAFDGGRIFF